MSDLFWLHDCIRLVVMVPNDVTKVKSVLQWSIHMSKCFLCYFAYMIDCCPFTADANRTIDITLHKIKNSHLRSFYLNTGYITADLVVFILLR
jgi:formate hydrogenlyase subunit 6/NADH:ubiquinone oxidoreductase subunit I